MNVKSLFNSNILEDSGLCNPSKHHPLLLSLGGWVLCPEVLLSCLVIPPHSWS